jgi:hypothetical protein
MTAQTQDSSKNIHAREADALMVLPTSYHRIITKMRCCHLHALAQRRSGAARSAVL